MAVRYFQPLAKAWGRMIDALFKPFNFKKWLVVGFTAFLAGLTDWNGSSSVSDKDGGCCPDFGEIINFPKVAWEWLANHPGWFALILFGVFLFLAFIAVLTWLSSRGEFMFLHNVVQDVSEVKKPWHQYRMHGDSLFLWRLCYGLVCLLIILTLLVLGYDIAVNAYEGNISRGMTITYAVCTAIAALVTLVIAGYISLFLNDFVVPIMYKRSMSASQAWSQVLPLFKRHVFHFLFYGVFVLLLKILVAAVILIIGICTSCQSILSYLSSTVLSCKIGINSDAL